MHITVKCDGTLIGDFYFPKGQEYYAWDCVKDFCKAHSGEVLYITVDPSRS